jgi:hypothetical protein
MLLVAASIFYLFLREKYGSRVRESYYILTCMYFHSWPDVITVFLRSLTKYMDGKLIAVIVSGYDGVATVLR